MLNAFSRFFYSRYALFIAIGVCFFLGLGWVPLFDLDEGAFTEATREMLASGVYSATYLDGEPRYDKPIFFYWIQAISISAFGFNEWAFRLPSTLAACLWAWAIFVFVREQFGSHRAQIATLFMISCLWVGLISRSAIADAMLNLFLTLTLFDLWRFLKSGENKFALRFHLWMALGTLVKGPVAVVVPVAISFIYVVSQGTLLKQWKAYFNFGGWALYLLVVSPWLIAVYLEQGSGFFEGFILEHNLKRFSDTRESHGGSIFYYFGALPLILLPLSGLLFKSLGKIKRIWRSDLHRFLSIWFIVIFVVFSFSKTQLPHYILNCCVPLFIIFATIPKLQNSSRWILAFPLIFFVLFVGLPEILSVAAESSRGYDAASLAVAGDAFTSNYRFVAILVLMLAIAITFVPKLVLWQRLSAVGLLLNFFVFTQFVQVASYIQQKPIHDAIAYLDANHPEKTVVAYKMHMPSFSVYREKITPLRAPKENEIALVRTDRLKRLKDEIAPNIIETLFTSGGLVLVINSAGDTEAPR